MPGGVPRSMAWESEIVYSAGRLNAAVNALSRNPQPEAPGEGIADQYFFLSKWTLIFSIPEQKSIRNALIFVQEVVPLLESQRPFILTRAQTCYHAGHLCTDGN